MLDFLVRSGRGLRGSHSSPEEIPITTVHLHVDSVAPVRAAGAEARHRRAGQNALTGPRHIFQLNAAPSKRKRTTRLAFECSLAILRVRAF